MYDLGVRLEWIWKFVLSNRLSREALAEASRKVMSGARSKLAVRALETGMRTISRSTGFCMFHSRNDGFDRW